jgi:hypothetical protein
MEGWAAHMHVSETSIGCSNSHFDAHQSHAARGGWARYVSTADFTYTNLGSLAQRKSKRLRTI